ncbi:hypothetical protein OAM18_05535 [Candidatus Pelagibacter sp.]|nr:hypothetical protein [Candidatus Pelagibacter sp.]
MFFSSDPLDTLSIESDFVSDPFFVKILFISISFSSFFSSSFNVFGTGNFSKSGGNTKGFFFSIRNSSEFDFFLTSQSIFNVLASVK